MRPRHHSNLSRQIKHSHGINACSRQHPVPVGGSSSLNQAAVAPIAGSEVAGGAWIYIEHAKSGIVIRFRNCLPLIGMLLSPRIY
jgi:hypothetical protein